jgi:hypothetical protein
LMTESQNGFRTGRSCTARIFCLKPFIEKWRVYDLETHCLL